jgi:hypothetical protein
MTNDGYGCFYAIPSDKVHICMTSYKSSEVTNAEELWNNIQKALVAIRDIADEPEPNDTVVLPTL